MARTPLAGRLEEIAATVAREENAASDGRTRREFLRQAGAAGAAATAAGALWRVPAAAGADGPRIVIVGGGLAGLTCAYRLKQAGQIAKVHEASDRLGGRCWTIRDYFAGGQIAEHGGELIDQGHTQIRHLAKELDLKLDNLLSAEANGTEPLYYFDEAPYTYDEARADIKKVWQKIHSDVSAASYPTTFEISTERGQELDQMSIIDWINESVPGGIGSRLGQLLDVAYTIEYGADSSDQSALNLLYLLGYLGQGNLRIFGPSNEKYRVHGGNDRIVKRLRDALSGQIERSSELVAIELRSDGAYSLSFREGVDTVTKVADEVVLALPFTILRTSVDISNAGFSELKRKAIAELGMGTNSKLHLQFENRHWETLGCNGETFSDEGYQNTWDVSRAQPGDRGILVDYTGGTIGASFTGTAQAHAVQFLSQLEPVLPGISAPGLWNGRATLDFWLGNPYTLGSYSYWKVGQYTAFSGIESRQEGNCHFAGEHTSQDFQGYLNGAVETGERAAGEILADLK
jgi:monoamine oxidase